jgi:fibro-slime domain-containing protein
MRFYTLVLYFSATLALGCGGSDDDTASNGNGAGGGANAGNGGNGTGGLNLGGGANAGNGGSANGTGTGGNGYCGSTLTGTIRDFQIAHPDFEHTIGDDLGLVQTDLGSDDKPVYAGGAGTSTTTGQANFDQWFRDVPGINQSQLLSLTLSPAGGNVYTYSNNAFFPIDNQLFGNESNPHNFHFTFELHTKFVYLGGEVFTFTGDDDLFVFVNRKLAIDLGGVHGAQNGQVDLDARAGELGITQGGTYQLDFFFAERHTSESNFRIDTTIGSFVDCGPPAVR